MKKFFFLFLVFALIGSCGSTKEFTAVPPNADLTSAPKQTIEMTAEHFHFAPDEIHVKRGTLVTLDITSIDGTHGFKLGAFGIDIDLQENVTASTTFLAAKKGEYGFRCSHFCGVGHFGMTGKIVVE